MAILAGAPLAQAKPTAHTAIIGGSPAPEGQYPYAVRVEALYPNQQGELEEQPFCSGSLIAPGYVLTAAHCISSEDLDRKIDELKPQVRFSNLPGSPTRAVVRAAFWRDYELSMPSRDLAVLELSEEAPASAVELGEAPGGGERVKELGYGPTQKNLADGMQSILYQGDMEVARDQQACYAMIGEEGVYTETEICAVTDTQAGLLAGACPGDSGGALLNSRGQLVGVTSWGQLENCNNQAEYRSTVFAKPQAGKEWLRRQTGAPLFGLPALEQQTEVPQGGKIKLLKASKKGLEVRAYAQGKDWVARVGLEAKLKRGKKTYKANAIATLKPNKKRIYLAAPKSWRKSKISRISYSGYSRFYNSLENGTTVIPKSVQRRYR